MKEGTEQGDRGDLGPYGGLHVVGSTVDWLEVQQHAQEDGEGDPGTFVGLRACGTVELPTQVQFVKVRHKEELQKTKSGRILLNVCPSVKMPPFLRSWKKQRSDCLNGLLFSFVFCLPKHQKLH